MNRCHIYGVALLLLVSSEVHAMQADLINLSRGFIYQYGQKLFLTDAIDMLKAKDYYLERDVNGLLSDRKKAIEMKSLAIYALSRHNKLQALAAKCSGKYSLAPDSIALLLSTVLVDGGVNICDGIRECKRLTDEFNDKSSEGSQLSFDAYRGSDIAKSIALKTVKDCVKTAVAIGLQKGTVHIMKNYGFDAYLRDLSKSKQLSKTLGFVLARGIAGCMVESTVNVMYKNEETYEIVDKYEKEAIEA